MEIIVALHQLQKNLNVPKLQENKFGNYKFRSCEDILAAIKPILPEDSILLLNDEIIYIEGRYYVKATASFCMPGEKQLTATGYAREADEKKGMDVAQITGASSSYARKYALNALLAIDDTKDPDTTNTHGKEPTQKPSTTFPPSAKPSKLDTQTAQAERLIKLINSDKTVDELNKRYKDNASLIKALNTELNKKVIDAFTAHKKVILTQETTPPIPTPDPVSKPSAPQNEEETPSSGDDDLPPIFDDKPPGEERSEPSHREKAIISAKELLDSAGDEHRNKFWADFRKSTQFEKMPLDDQLRVRNYYESLAKK